MVLERFRLDGQVAVVTGAGRGIGAASALALAEAGADVLISARTEDQLKDVAAQIEALGRKALIVPADLSDLDQAAGLAQAAVDGLGRLDVVVNNVGGSMPREFLRTNTKALEEAFHFNVSTAHALTRAALPHLLEAGRVGRQHLLGDGPGVRPRLRRLRHRQGRARRTGPGSRPRTCRRASGSTPSPSARSPPPRWRWSSATTGCAPQMEQGTPLRRIGDPDEIAATVLFLASPAGGYITGKVIEVDGGLQSPNFDMGLPDLGETL